MRPLKQKLRIAMGALAGILCLSVGVRTQIPPSMRALVPIASNASLGAADVPSCTGAALVSGVKPAADQSNPNPHKVTLSWSASVPVSASPRDAINGYYVYRSSASQTYSQSNRLNATPLQGTTCVDVEVVAQGVYFYVVTAVAQGGESGQSKEIKVTVPPDSPPQK